MVTNQLLGGMILPVLPIRGLVNHCTQLYLDPNISTPFHSYIFSFLSFLPAALPPSPFLFQTFILFLMHLYVPLMLLPLHVTLVDSGPPGPNHVMGKM